MGNLRFTEFLSPLGREVKKLPPSNHTHLENKRTRSPQQPARFSGEFQAARKLQMLDAEPAPPQATIHISGVQPDAPHAMGCRPRRAEACTEPSHLFRESNAGVSSLGISKAWLTTFAMTHRRISYRAVLAAWRQNRGTSAEASYLIASLGAPKTHRRLLCAWRHNDANKNTNANATNQKRKHDGGIVKPLCRPCVNMQTANSHIVSS
jgi:hypothetical protein